MTGLNYAKHEPISLKSHPEFNEKWLQDRIAEDPTILGLGETVLLDRERPLAPEAGSGRRSLIATERGTRMLPPCSWEHRNKENKARSERKGRPHLTAVPNKDD